MELLQKENTESMSRKYPVSDRREFPKAKVHKSSDQRAQNNK